MRRCSRRYRKSADNQAAGGQRDSGVFGERRHTARGARRQRSAGQTTSQPRSRPGAHGRGELKCGRDTVGRSRTTAGDHHGLGTFSQEPLRPASSIRGAAVVRQGRSCARHHAPVHERSLLRDGLHDDSRRATPSRVHNSRFRSPPRSPLVRIEPENNKTPGL